MKYLLIALLFMGCQEKAHCQNCCCCCPNYSGRVIIPDYRGVRQIKLFEISERSPFEVDIAYRIDSGAFNNFVLLRSRRPNFDNYEIIARPRRGSGIIIDAQVLPDEKYYYALGNPGGVFKLKNIITF